MTESTDGLDALERNIPLSEKLHFVHETLRARLPDLDRISIALYDASTDTVATFIDSSGQDRPLVHYETHLSDAASLAEIRRTRKPRLISDMRAGAGTRPHTERMVRHGYRTSYTLPIIIKNVFYGFVFFNSYRPEAFRPEDVQYLDVFGHLIALMIANELITIQTLRASVATASDLAHHRDLETGVHLDRMAHYARLIASGLATTHGLDDQYIEYVFLFAPLHDIGKISIPDRILLKPGLLESAELTGMQRHVDSGRKIVDDMLARFGLDTLPYVEILRNIVAYHHERLDGTGYTHHLRGREIPLEARIISVADVYDALTSQRAYKKAWTADEAAAELRRQAGISLDSECVEALLRRPDRLAEIQTRFKENAYG